MKTLDNNSDVPQNIKDYRCGKFYGLSVAKEVCRDNCTYYENRLKAESPCYQFCNGEAIGCVYAHEGDKAPVYFIEK